jgi:hypothetical protein
MPPPHEPLELAVGRHFDARRVRQEPLHGGVNVASFVSDGVGADGSRHKLHGPFYGP